MQGSDQDDDGEVETWIQWFCHLEGHNVYCEVDSSFIEDPFNLYGLRLIVPHYRDCIELILDRAPRTAREGTDHEYYQEASTLYGLIHARFITTSRGLSFMAEKYDEQHFGVCPRTLCHGAAVLPVGLSNDLKAGGCTKLFCPHCEEVYEPPAASPLASIDGAAFGPTFAHMLLLTKPQLMLPKNSGVYVPRIFGFKVANQRGRAAVTAAARPPSGALSDDDRSADGAAATAGHGSAAAATAASSSRSFDRAEAIRNDRIGAGIQAALAAASSLSASSVGGGSGSGGGGGSRSGGSLSAVSGSVANYGGVLDAVMARIRRGRPLTSSYPNWQRPKEDDFNDTEDEAMERKRRKLGDG